MHLLITFATHWGSKYGGINSFNTDFLTAFGIAYHLGVEIICIVGNATQEEIDNARNAHITLVPLPYVDSNKFSNKEAQASIDEIKRLKQNLEPEKTIWLGHDLITGLAAIEAAKIAGGRSVVIHHMSYSHYESYAENSHISYQKTQLQKNLFQQADLVLAIGPLLRDALIDLIGATKQVHMLIPGLAEIEAKPAPKTFTAFLSGRLSNNAARIKQGHLGIAAFAKAHREARENKMPDALYQKPKLILRGVDFESKALADQDNSVSNPEIELKNFAQEYAQGVINLEALPYINDREELFDQLSSASVALMPSWHEGFGLTAWEAIAARVPLVISKESGVYRLLEEVIPGAGAGCVYPIDIAGAVEHPFFNETDLRCVTDILKDIAYHSDKARQKAAILKSLVDQYSWTACAENAVKIWGWELKKGSIPTEIPEFSSNINSLTHSSYTYFSLQIPSRRWQLGGAIADSQLLRAEEGLVPFDPARQPDLDALHAWLDDTENRQAVRLITGAGGLGKTRLALELCRLRVEMNWLAGLLDHDLEAKDMLATWQNLRSYNQPLLIIIDYAETRQNTFLALVKAILQSPIDKPVRLLLLARDGGEWWDNLPAKDPKCEPLLSGYATSGPYRLPPLHTSIEDRRNAYERAKLAFARALDVPAPDVTPELLGEHFDRPLYLQMAALLSLHGERPTTAQGLTKALLNHERRYWLRSLTSAILPEADRYAEQLLALTTLAGGFSTPKLALEYWINATGNTIGVATFNALFHALEPLYPGKQGLQALRPDLLGEALVAQALLKNSSSELLNAVLSSSASSTVRCHALTVLARTTVQHFELHEILIEALAGNFAHCCRELVTVASETPSELPALSISAFMKLAPNIKNQVAGLLKTNLTVQSIQLSEFYSCVSEHLVVTYRQKLLKNKKNIELMKDYAQALGNHALVLGNLGKNVLALTSSQEVVEIFNYLQKLNQGRYEGDYAKSLCNCSNELSNAGQDTIALDYAKHALEIRQRLVRKDPDRFEAEYATSLSTYASRLNDMGQNEVALEYSEKALEIRKRLMLKNPDRYEPDYASSLNNHANRLSNFGSEEAALDFSNQALEIRQRLVKKNPDRFEPEYTNSLNNHANRLSNCGMEDKALEYSKQALEIRQRLAKKNPERFESDYAKSLTAYASRLNDVGQDDAALYYSAQGLEICKRMLQKNPDRYESEYAISLGNHSIRLSEADQVELALEYAEQVMEIRERLLQKNRDRYEPEYAASLINLANHYSDVGQYETAVDYSFKGLLIRERLMQEQPESNEPIYAATLENHANLLIAIGRYAEAVDHIERAFLIQKQLTQKNPDRFAEDFFSTSCSKQFLLWLNDSTVPDTECGEWKLLPLTTSNYRRPLRLLHQAFVEACLEPVDLIAQAEAFKRVKSHWSNLSPAQKFATRAYWLCAATWCFKYEKHEVENLDWMTIFRKFTFQRKERLPLWMEKLQERLTIAWPN